MELTMEDITKMTDNERAQYIEDLLNSAVEEENEALKVSNRFQEEINNIRDKLIQMMRL